jgi:hypothetical protein
LATRTCASSAGPGRPRSIGKDGSGGWVIVSHCRQLSFGRTCTTTLKCDGTYSRTSRSSVPMRLSLVLPQAGQAQAASCSTRSRGRCAGSGWRPRRRRAGRSRLVRCRRRLLGLVLRLVRLELADQQLELLDPLRRAAVAGSLQERQLGLQLLDVQGLGVELGLQPSRERPERVGIGGQCGRCQRHGPG